MSIKVTLKNYRCFPDNDAAVIELRDGFTAIIGPNNAGKSSLLKFFFEFRKLFELLSSATSEFDRGFRSGSAFQQIAGTFEPDEVFCNRNNRDLGIAVEFEPEPGSPDSENPIIVRKVELVVTRGTTAWRGQLVTVSGPVDLGSAVFASGSYRQPTGAPLADLRLVFGAFRTLSKTLYIPPFRNAVNIGSSESYFDMHVGQAFIRRWRAIKTGVARKENEAAYALTNLIKRIFGFGELEINPAADDQTLQVFIDGRSFKLPELGSGLTQFVLVLTNAAVFEPTFVLIDEPELNLHPSLQLQFVTALASFARNGVLFGTHSIGLARSAADRIYSVTRTVDRMSHVAEYERTPRLSELVGELSYSEYKEVGFKKILLVEGPTDIRVMQQFLRFHRKDLEVLSLPLGGSGLINPDALPQLLEIKRITADISAIIDSERSGAGHQLSPERQGFVTACGQAEISCHVLERRATENYLSDRAIKKIKGGQSRALGPYEKLSDLPVRWPKADNWRIASEMTKEDLSGTDLGDFLAQL